MTSKSTKLVQAYPDTKIVDIIKLVFSDKTLKTIENLKQELKKVDTQDKLQEMIKISPFNSEKETIEFTVAALLSKYSTDDITKMLGCTKTVAIWIFYHMLNTLINHTENKDLI